MTGRPLRPDASDDADALDASPEAADARQAVAGAEGGPLAKDEPLAKDDPLAMGDPLEKRDPDPGAEEAARAVDPASEAVAPPSSEGESTAMRLRDGVRRVGRRLPALSFLGGAIRIGPGRERSPGLWRALVLNAPRRSWAGLDAALPEFRKLFAKPRTDIAEIRAELTRGETDVLLVWSAASLAPSAAAAIVEAERPVAWAGFGATHLRLDGETYYSVTLDWTGAPDDAAAPSDLEDLLNHHDVARDAATMAAARKLCALHRAAIGREVASDLASDLVGDSAGEAADETADDAETQPGADAPPVIGLALQSAEDRRLTQAGGQTLDPAAFVDQGAAQFPGSPMLTHAAPDLPKPLLAEIDKAAASRGLGAPTRDKAAFLRAIDRLATHSAPLGLDALMAGRPVTCWGAPFYAGWGATEDLTAVARRERTRDAAEIAAIALIAYPRWLDAANRLVDIRAKIDQAQTLTLVD